MSNRKGSGQQQSGDAVEFDLGEKLDRALRSKGLGAGSGKRGSGYRPGHAGYRPGMYGGRPGGRSSWELGRKLGIPATVKTKELVGGGLIGVVGNRVVERVVPGLFGVNDKLLAEAIGFGAGIVPFVVKQNDLTTGIALPGLFYLGGSLVDLGLDWLGITKTALSGPAAGKRKAVDGRSAREKLAEVQSRTRSPKSGGRSAVATGSVHKVA